MKKALVVLFFLAVALPVFGQQVFNSCVENETVDCPVTLPSAFTTANSRLPDPFMKLDGTRMTAREEWACRRQEILRLAERTIYGVKPPRPSSVTGTVTNTSITVNVSEGGRNGSFSVTVTLPTTGTAPYPAVIMYGNGGASAATIRARGVATINYTATTIGAESGGNRNNKSGLFYTIYGTTHRAGTLVAWAWGVSRIIDVIESDPNNLLDPTAIGVTGCSRFGKGPFAAGALDSRIALTMPMESGTGGTNIMRGAFADRDQSGGSNGAQSPSSAYGEQPWLGDDFSSFTNNPNNLPIDMHQVVGLIAPRGFLVLDKTASSAGQWLNIPSSHASALAGAEIYKALGVGGNMHYINTPTTPHCQWDNSYNAHLQNFIDIFLLRTGEPGTTPLFNATTANAPNMNNWIDWTTPTLTGQLTLGGCGDPPPPPTGFTLTAAASPAIGGTVNRDPTPPASGRYEDGTAVTLTAVAETGWRFDGWSGDLTEAASPASVTMNANKTVTARFLPTADGTDNLIRNGNFANTQNWTLNTWQNSAATFGVSGGAANITGITRPTGTGAADHSLQLVQNGIPLHHGITYRLTFEASAAAARDISVYIQMDAEPYTSYLTETVSLTTTREQPFTYTFTMDAPTNENARIAFNFGGATPNVSISNARLVWTAEETSSARNVQNTVRAHGPLVTVQAKTLVVNESPETAVRIRVVNLTGRTIASFNTNGGANLSLRKIPAGVYIIEAKRVRDGVKMMSNVVLR
ncbi:MAG: carbohydrate binding domain-containing protein [Chitinispirillales bacterium]|nr:carbohydrate binding domain-containing protein [Chitinispirillales bacterium]